MSLLPPTKSLRPSPAPEKAAPLRPRSQQKEGCALKSQRARGRRYLGHSRAPHVQPATVPSSTRRGSRALASYVPRASRVQRSRRPRRLLLQPCSRTRRSDHQRRDELCPQSGCRAAGRNATEIESGKQPSFPGRQKALFLSRERSRALARARDYENDQRPHGKTGDRASQQRECPRELSSSKGQRENAGQDQHVSEGAERA